MSFELTTFYHERNIPLNSLITKDCCIFVVTIVGIERTKFMNNVKYSGKKW